MTEGLGEFMHNGGGGETPVAEPETAAEKRARKRAERDAKNAAEAANGETTQSRVQGGWSAKHPDGEQWYYTGEQEAREHAILPGTFEFREFGETTAWTGDEDKRPRGSYWAREKPDGEWVTFPTLMPALRHATPWMAVTRLTNSTQIPR